MSFLLQILFYFSLLLTLQAEDRKCSISLKELGRQMAKMISIQKNFTLAYNGETVQLTEKTEFINYYFEKKIYYTMFYQEGHHIFNIQNIPLTLTSETLFQIFHKTPKGSDLNFIIRKIEETKFTLLKVYFTTRNNTYRLDNKIVFNWEDNQTEHNNLNASSTMVFPIIKTAKVYAEVNRNLPKEYWNYEPIWGDFNAFQTSEKLGYGNTSEVYEGIKKDTDEKCAIKIMAKINIKKIIREIKINQAVNDGPNINKLLYIVKDSNETIALISEYVNSTEYKALRPLLTDYDIRYYMFELLKALEYCHSMGIMHRDIKPANVLIDHEAKKLRLIDFGLSEFYYPYQKYSITMGTLHFQGPELLLRYQYYDYSLDMWSTGCLFAGLLFHKLAFFALPNHTIYNQLVKQASILGTAKLFEYVKKYNLQIDPPFNQTFEKKQWSRYKHHNNSHLINAEALDLLDKLLQYDPEERLTAREAMEHPYFTKIVKEQGGLPPLNKGLDVEAYQMRKNASLPVVRATPDYSNKNEMFNNSQNNVFSLNNNYVSKSIT